MSNATKKPAEPTTVKVVDPAKAPAGKLQHIGGSKSDDWNNFLTDQRSAPFGLLRRMKLGTGNTALLWRP